MRKALWISLLCGITVTCFAFGCKTKSNSKVTKRVLPAGGTARIPADWDGLTDWNGNVYTLGDIP